MARLIDLSGKITSGMWDYNQLDLGRAVLPPVEIKPVATIAAHGFDAHTLQLSTLTGSYLETSAHLIAGGPTIDQISVEAFIRPARILRLPSAEPYTLIRVDDLRRCDPGIREGEALLIDTGWGRRWNQPEYVTQAPAFACSTLAWFLEQPFSILGLDTPVMECRWADRVDADIQDEVGSLLAPLYKRGMLLLAPLVNLDQADTLEGTLIAFPLNIAGVCSTPCRAVFVESVRWPPDPSGAA